MYINRGIFWNILSEIKSILSIFLLAIQVISHILTTKVARKVGLFMMCQYRKETL